MSSEKNSSITKRIPENKLKAFSIGKTNPIPKKGSILKRREKEQEKKKLDIEETQQVFDEFVQSFEDIQTVGKTFVRGSTIDPDTGGEVGAQPKIYNPVIQKVKSEGPAKSENADSIATKKKGKEHKRSILESFKEELKRTQKERHQRHVTKHDEKDNSLSPIEPNLENVGSLPDGEVMAVAPEAGSNWDGGDQQTTNLYVGNINPKMNEEMLCQVFGKFGPLASVKVMWPRTDEEKARNYNCGFVAYMKREHALEALNELKGTQLLDFSIQLGWGKPVPLPLNPVYVHHELIKIQSAPPQLPDPPSGLPFNAQYQHGPKDVKVFLGQGRLDSSNHPKNEPDILVNSLTRVAIPSDDDLMKRIHRMTEFVVREGPMFEAMIMTREINNQAYRFLFDNQSPSHVYYRWKLYSILQGDSPETWRTEDFRMFQNGSIWRPPPLQPIEFPDLKPKVSEIDIVRKGRLSTRQRDELEDILREMSMERKSIYLAMVFCIDYSDFWEEIIDCITQSLTIIETPLSKKVARLYLITDILNNTAVKINSVSNFQNGFEKKFESVFKHFAEVYDSITDQMHSEHFKILVLKILFAWERQTIFSVDFLIGLKRIFLPNSSPDQLADEYLLENLDGQPMESFDEPNLADIDGTPMPSDLDGALMNIQYDEAAHEAKFKPFGSFVSVEHEQKPRISKWELIDDPLDEILEAAEEKEQQPHPPPPAKPKDVSSRFLSGSNLSETMRNKLREIDHKVVKFSDELESIHSRKDLSKEANRGFIVQKIEGYRKLLLEDFYQTHSLDTAATDQVSMDISKPAPGKTPTPKASKFFSQYTDSETEYSGDSLPVRNNNKNRSSKSHKSESRSNREARSRSRSFSLSLSPSSDEGSPPRSSKSHEHSHHSKKSKRRHYSSSPSESKTSKRARNYSSRKERSSKKRRSSSNSPSHHPHAKSSKKSRRHSSDSHSPSPHKKSKKSKHN